MTATSEPHCLMTVIFIFNTIMTVRTTHMICVLMVVRGNLIYYYMDQNEFQYIKDTGRISTVLAFRVPTALKLFVILFLFLTFNFCEQSYLPLIL